jgi:hypothetical protein
MPTETPTVPEAAHRTDLEALVAEAEALRDHLQAVLRSSTGDDALTLGDQADLLTLAHQLLTAATWAWGSILELRGLLSDIPRLVGADGKPAYRPVDVPLLQAAAAVRAGLIQTQAVVDHAVKLEMRSRG